MRLLIFGGSFNPPHIAHLLMADEAAYEFKYDRIVFIPALSPPHKALSEDPGAEMRVTMLDLALAGEPRYMLDKCEILRGGMSYTIDTVRYIIATYKLDAKPGLLIGDDLLPGFYDWKEAELLSKLCDIIVVSRNNKPVYIKYPHKIAHNLKLDISSTDIKNRI